MVISLFLSCGLLGIKALRRHEPSIYADLMVPAQVDLFIAVPWPDTVGEGGREGKRRRLGPSPGDARGHCILFLCKP